MNGIAAYNKELKNIKLHNVPAMAARMAKTILELPRCYMNRKVTDASGGVIEDHSGQVIDSYWDEIVGRAMAKVDGIYLNDAKSIIRLVVALNEHLVKWQHGYLGRGLTGFDAAHEEFMTEWRPVLDKVTDIKRNDVKTTYLNLGFKLDQMNLNDSPQFYDDTYMFLIETAKTPLQDIIASILMVEKSLTSAGPKVQVIKSAIRSTMLLFEAVADLIHDMNWVIENMSPVMRSGSKRNSFREPIVNYSNVHNFDPTKYAGVKQVPEEAQVLDVWIAKITPPEYRCRLSVIVTKGWRVEDITADGKPVDFAKVENSDGKIVYLSDKISVDTDKVIGLEFGHPTYKKTDVPTPIPEFTAYYVPEQ